MEFDENDTTRTRLRRAMEMIHQNEEKRREDNAAMEKRVKAIADAIDKQNGERVGVWAWVKKILSFAHSEADKIHLEK